MIKSVLIAVFMVNMTILSSCSDIAATLSEQSPAPEPSPEVKADPTANEVLPTAESTPAQDNLDVGVEHENPTSEPTQIASNDPTETPEPEVVESSNPALALANPYTNHVLVLYNQNATRSQEIAEYYANARGIAANRLCGVKLPAGHYATWGQLMVARKTIVETCICGIIQLSSCTLNDLDAIAAASPITHLAIIRGIPGRIKQASFDTSGEEPVVDFYLAHLIYKGDDTFTNGTTAVVPSNAPQYPEPQASAWTQVNYDGFGTPSLNYKYERGYVPAPVSAVTHRQVVYSRIDGITVESAKALIDRTLEAEKKGITGNSFVFTSTQYSRQDFPEGSASAPATRMYAYGERYYQGTVDRMLDLRGIQRGSCTDYWYAFDASMPGYGDTWLDHLNCGAGGYMDRVGDLNKAPGHGTLPSLNNATSFYYRGVPDSAHQSAFGGVWSRMMAWHKDATTTTCNTQCNGDATCMAASTDPFKEIDTRCVGVGRGFIGFLTRSYTVGYYGIYPQGWKGRHTSDSGATERTPPTRMTEINGAATNTFIRFAPDDGSNTPLCSPSVGAAEAACPADIPFAIMRTEQLATPITLAASSTGIFNLRFKYRYHGSNSDGKIQVRIRFDADGALGSGIVDSTASITLTPNTASTWQQYSGNFSATGTGTVNYVHLFLYSGFAQKLQHRLDLDAVELISPTSVNLIPADIGGFEAPYINNLTEGDWAANMIDRLGGIGWWGSSSHFEGNGTVFSNPNYHISSFYAGRSLAESVYLSGSANTDLAAGMIYGDPIYSPASVRLHLGEGDQSLLYRANNAPDTEKTELYSNPFITTELKFRTTYYTIQGSDNSTYAKPLFMNAINGRDHANVAWSIDRCEVNTNVAPRECNEGALWTSWKTGLGPQLNKQIVSDLREMVDDQLHARKIYLRLKVYDVSSPAQDPLFTYSYFDFVP